MLQLPFELPKSLVSYAEHFGQDPEKATLRLERQLNKRGPDAVGHFLLAWFYHLQKRHDEAVEEALKAKIFAPGSPFFDKLHYYLVHPDTFEAWIPETSARSYGQTTEKSLTSGPVLNLDALIEKLAEAESGRIKITAGKKPKDLSEVNPDDTDDIASDTLASIHETQGKLEAAIKTYSRLKKLNKEKKSFYEEKISELKELRENAKQEKEEKEEEKDQ